MLYSWRNAGGMNFYRRLSLFVATSKMKYRCYVTITGLLGTTEWACIFGDLCTAKIASARNFAGLKFCPRFEGSPALNWEGLK